MYKRQTYTRVDENNVAYTDEILHNDKGLTVTEALALHVRGFTSVPGLTPKTRTTTSKYDTETLQNIYELYNEHFANTFEVQIPEFEYPTEYAEEVSSIEFDEMCIRDRA